MTDRPYRRFVGGLGFAMLLLPAGAGTGVAAVALNAQVWGAALGAAALLVTAYALPPGGRRAGFAVGLVAVVGLAVAGRPEGDWAVVADWRGYLLLGSTLGVLCFAVATLGSGARRTAAARPPACPAVSGSAKSSAVEGRP